VKQASFMRHYWPQRIRRSLGRFTDWHWRYRHLDYFRLLSAVIGSVFLIVGPCAAAENADNSLLVYAVSLHLASATQKWSGYGIYLGNGLIITAAHVVGHAWMTKPSAVIGGREYPARVVKEGDFEHTDLTLLAVDQERLPVSLRLRRNPLCSQLPWPGQDVITVMPEGTARSHIISPTRLPVGVRKFDTVIGDVAGTGNSGSGVFDANHRCLLGIMSRKISQNLALSDGRKTTRDIAKYFVPASAISDFIPAGLRF
jgi:hypothetical protein